MTSNWSWTVNWQLAWALKAALVVLVLCWFEVIGIKVVQDLWRYAALMMTWFKMTKNNKSHWRTMWVLIECWTILERRPAASRTWPIPGPKKRILQAASFRGTAATMQVDAKVISPKMRGIWSHETSKEVQQLYKYTLLIRCVLCNVWCNDYYLLLFRDGSGEGLPPPILEQRPRTV